MTAQQTMTWPFWRTDRCRVPTILQMENAECGAACLAMVLAAFGRWEPLDAVRDRCGSSRDGVSAADLILAARHVGVEAEALACETDDLPAIGFPQIAFWNFDHFVVIEGHRRGTFTINDPTCGRRQIGRAEMVRAFTGVTLAFRPGPDLQRVAPARGTILRLLATLRGSADGFLAVVLAGLVSIALGILIPGFTKVFIDDYLVQGYGHWLIPLVGGMLALGLLRVAATALHARALLLLQTKINAVVTANFVWRVLHQPFAFFARRSPGEISGRAQLAGQIAATVSGPLTQATVNVVAMAGYTAIMLAVDVVLTGLVLGLSLVNLLILRSVTAALRENAHGVQLAAGRAHAAGIQGVALLESYRATGSEEVLFNRLMTVEVAHINAEQSAGRTARLLAVLPFASGRLMAIGILGVGALEVIRTDLTFGSLTAFIMLAELFAASLGALTGVGVAVGSASSAFTRLGDATDHPEMTAPAPSETGLADGRVAVAGLAFAYADGRPVLIEANLTVEPGEVVGIAGTSGCGKTTLGRILVGLTAPASGSVAIGCTAVVASSAPVGYVDQTPFFPNGPLRGALTLWQPETSTDAILRAVADVGLTEIVMQRPGGLDGRIAEGASDFSGGEQQRLAIARALLCDASVLVLDDATSALDEAAEARIVANLRRRGLTVILLTNRASALRHVDRVVVLHEGRLVPLDSDVVDQGITATLAPAAPGETRRAA